jgi:hypothetical protein
MTFEEIGPDHGGTSPEHSKFGQKKSAASGSSGPSASLIALVVLAALAVVFVLQNRSTVRTHFLFFTTTTRVWTAIGVALVVGIGLDRLATLWWRRRKSKST